MGGCNPVVNHSSIVITPHILHLHADVLRIHVLQIVSNMGSPHCGQDDPTKTLIQRLALHASRLE